MPTFQSNKFRGASNANEFAARYRKLIDKRPFLMFGLPFMAIIIAGSFVLTPATAIRYERHDRKVRQMTKDEELNVRRSARKVDMREEYYVSLWSKSWMSLLAGPSPVGDGELLIVGKKLAGRDLDAWEQKRVELLPGESDGILR